jgi:hypothetical protein
MAAAVIIYIHPQLETDWNEDSAGLLRVILYTMNSTIFGGNVPGIPDSTDPRDGVVTVLMLLYLDLTFTMSCVVFALFTKQLLTVFTMTGLEESIARNSKGQSKWFIIGLRMNFLILSLALQLSLLFLDCAVIVYIWDVNNTLARFILYVTIIIIGLWCLFCMFAGFCGYVASRYTA